MKKHKHLIIVLFILSVFGLGFAYLQTSLTINGITNVDYQSWNIHFVPESAVFTGRSHLESTPYFSNNNSILNYEITFRKPGDEAIVTIDAVNEGTLDAMFQGFSIKVNGTEIHSDSDLPVYLDYHVSYADNYPLSVNDLFKANSTESFTFVVEFKRDITNLQLPQTAQTLNLSFEMKYIQAEGNAVSLDRTVYTTSDQVFEIGKPIPEEATLYEDRDLAMQTFGHPLYIKHTLHGNSVLDSMVGFKYNGVITEIPYGESYYDSNRATLSSMFEIPDDNQNQCGFAESSVGGSGYVCLSITDSRWASELYPSVSLISIANGDYSCGVFFNHSACGLISSFSQQVQKYLNG